MKSLSFLGFSNYTVDKTGKVYNTKRKKYMSTHKNNSGYTIVSLTHDSDGKVNRLIHVLVAKSFIPNPESYADVGHKDDNKDNNNSSNLEWTTHSDNIKKTIPTRKKPGVLKKVALFLGQEILQGI